MLRIGHFSHLTKFCCILLLCAFAFDDSEHLLQNFGLAQTTSNLGNFRLGDDKRWKTQYHSYPHLSMDKLLLTRLYLSQVSNSRSGCLHAMYLNWSITKLANLELKISSEPFILSNVSFWALRSNDKAIISTMLYFNGM
jgi:hypothetical protein